jgi:hypothetical protein
MDTVVDMYFKLKAPFEEKKRAEFPDAIALVSLERWAELNKLKILVVSYDSGWEEYCASSADRPFPVEAETTVYIPSRRSTES